MKKAIFAGAALLLSSAASQAEAPQGTQDGPIAGAGPAIFVFVVEPEIVGLVIEAPMANYGVASDLVIPPQNHGVPEWDDYNALRAEISAAIAPEIDGIEASVASKFAFDQAAGCSYDEGSESIFKRDGQWIVTFDIEFACLNPSRVKNVSINVFDFEGFSDGSARVVNGDAVNDFPVDGINRMVEFW